jgi:hypothetical protein
VNSEARRYVPFFATVLAIVVLVALAFGAGYRLGAASHRGTHGTIPGRVL